MVIVYMVGRCVRCISLGSRIFIGPRGEQTREEIVSECAGARQNHEDLSPLARNVYVHDETVNWQMVNT